MYLKEINDLIPILKFYLIIFFYILFILLALIILLLANFYFINWFILYLIKMK